MKPETTFLPAVQLRKALAALLVSLTLFLGISIGQGAFAAPAQADTVRPETKAYVRDRAVPGLNSETQEGTTENNTNGLVESIKEGAETVKEKLNLDEPLPEGTKKFFKQVRGEDVEVNEPKPFGK